MDDVTGGLARAAGARGAIAVHGIRRIGEVIVILRSNVIHGRETRSRSARQPECLR